MAYRSRIVELTFSLDTSQYASADLLADTQALAGVSQSAGQPVKLQSITIVDEDDQKQALNVVFLDTNTSLGTENSAPNISDANARRILGHVAFAAGDYLDCGGVSVATIRNLNLVLKPASDATGLYVALVSAGTGTYTASGLSAKFGFE
ncbi:MAG: hypothetical protein E6Q97_16000 [Desulfurellales bacterium]|nr:MAG: hypothetical protein E6Q97_16000 [Desulfurellales bacterium]